ncbi:MAG: AAA family ATPase, partial [Candidatus Nanopelagicales bacterium]
MTSNAEVGLVELSLRSVGVIESAELSLGPGLTVITGETGAGKTMVLTGLSLVLGGPSDAGLVREGADQAVVEGRFAVREPEVLRITDEAGATLDEDGTLLLSRTLAAGGRSRAHLGGRTVPAALLADVGAYLVAVHGQDDQHRLLRPAEQRRALDRFGGDPLARALAAYRGVFDRLLDVRSRLDDVVAHERERAREAEELSAAIAELDRVRPRTGEDDELRADSARLAHLDEIVREATAARQVIDGVDPAVVAAHLARAAERDPDLSDLRDRAERAAAEWSELAVDLAGYLTDLPADPGRADEVEQRRATLGDLRRHLQRTGAWPELVDDAALISSLEEQLDSLSVELAACAQALSHERRGAAERLAEAITAELAALAMPNARIDVRVLPREVGSGEFDVTVDGELRGVDRHGGDIVEFGLAPREGAAARPLAKAASGGERSRIMLALEVTLAGLDPVPTFIFDEVDAGIGGKAAVEVGHRLALLAQTAQVVVVTHLAQVAAFADRHVVVR